MGRTPSNRYHKLRPPLPDGPFIPFQPRTYQRRILQAFSIDLTTKRPRTRHGVWVVHRRAGKDTVALAGIAIPALALRPGNYFHIFPKFAQAKKAIWYEERAFLDRFPPHWEPRRMETEQFIEMTIPPSGQKARYFLLGADDMETVSKLVGTNPLGIIYSEAAQMDDVVRDLFRPVLRENQGWELYVSTPRGKNWFYNLYQMAAGNSEWFSELLTVDHTRRDGPGEDGSPVITAEDVERDRKEGMAEELIAQEYFCSWSGFQHGTIYGDLLQEARKDGRITRCPHDPNKPVGVMLDLGRSDMLAIWFYQVHGSEIRLIDYHAERGSDTDSCIALLLAREADRRRYVYARVILPHDAAHEHFNAPESVLMKFRARMRCEIAVAEKTPMHLQVLQVRGKFKRFVFDEAKCGKELGPNIPSGLDALGNYRRRWDEEKKAFSPEPVHDQFSHGASAMAVGMAGWREGLEFPGALGRLQMEPITAFDPFNYEREMEEQVYGAHS